MTATFVCAVPQMPERFHDDLGARGIRPGEEREGASVGQTRPGHLAASRVTSPVRRSCHEPAARAAHDVYCYLDHDAQSARRS